MTRDIFISNENQVIKSGFNKDGCAHVTIRVIALENIKTLFTHVAVVLSYLTWKRKKIIYKLITECRALFVVLLINDQIEI